MRWQIDTETDLTQVSTYCNDALKPGNVLLLYGDMGAGKTTFVRYLATAMGIGDAVHSPTYTLCNTYGDGTLLHLDLYRIQSERDIANMDVERFLNYSKGIVVIEWPERLGRYMPTTAHTLTIEIGINEMRTFTFEHAASH